MKKILTYLLLLTAIAIVAFVVFFDRLSKNAIEAYAQQSLKTPVSIGELRSDLSAGKINLDFIEVKNPSHFKNENAFVLNHLDLEINPESDEDLIILEQLKFDGLLFTLEQDDDKVNLVTLLKNLESSPSVNNNIQYQNTTDFANEHSDTRVTIKSLAFVNTQLKIDTQWFKETVKVPDILIHDFGASRGIPINLVGAELMKIALRRIQDEVENQGLRLGEKEIKEGVRRQLESELEDIKGKLDDKAKGWLKKLGL